MIPHQLSSSLSLVGFLLVIGSCSTGEFTSNSGQTQDAKRKLQPPTTTTTTTTTNNVPPTINDKPPENNLDSDTGGDSTTIPGIQATKIGVHFEDSSDNDYNDVAVCFDAPFKVDARPGRPPKVVMAQPKGQKVKVFLKSLTGNVPTVTIKIIDSTEKVIFEKTKVYSRKANTNTENPAGPFFEENFPFGSRIYVQYRWGNAQLNTDGPGKVKIESNICRNTGS